EERVEGFVVRAYTMLFTERTSMVEQAAQRPLPAAYPGQGYVEAGGLVSSGMVLPDLYRRAASYVDKILKGAKPRDLPVETPTKYELVINAKTAKALGLTIPQSLLVRAERADPVTDRRAFVGALAGGLLDAPLAAGAPQNGL